MSNQELDRLAKRFKGAKARAVRAGLIPIDQVRAEIAERDGKITVNNGAQKRLIQLNSRITSILGKLAKGEITVEDAQFVLEETYHDRSSLIAAELMED
jgi:hypothetical protein